MPKAKEHFETRTVPITLSAEELRATAKRLSDQIAEHAKIHVQMQTASGTFRAALKTIAQEIARLAGIYQCGKEPRALRVRVSVVAGVEHLYDSETGEELAAAPAPKQAPLPFEADDDDAAFSGDPDEPGDDDAAPAAPQTRPKAPTARRGRAPKAEPTSASAATSETTEESSTAGRTS